MTNLHEIGEVDNTVYDGTAKKPLALCDIDNTLIDGISYFPLLYSQIEDGLVPKDYLSLADEEMVNYQKGLISYEVFVGVLVDIYAQGLQGVSVDEVAESTDKFFEKEGSFFGYAKPTLDQLKSTHEVVLVTGSSQFVASAVAKVLEVEDYRSSVYGTEQDRLNGKVVTYLATRQHKVEAIQELSEAHPFAGSFAFGDSEGDILMMEAVENQVCIRPTDELRRVAEAKGWHVVDSHAELDSPKVLYVVENVLSQAK